MVKSKIIINKSFYCKKLMQFLFAFVVISNLLISNSGFAQGKIIDGYKMGFGIASDFSDNAHGTIYTVSSHLYNGKQLFGIGPCVQKRKGNLCGLKINYTRFVIGQEVMVDNDFEAEDGYSRVQLFFFSSVRCIVNGRLSFEAIKSEESYGKNDQNIIDFSNKKLSTLDACLGFGLNIKITNQLVWYNSVGFGAYYHLNYKKVMYTEKIAPMLVVGTALRWNYLKR